MTYEFHVFVFGFVFRGNFPQAYLVVSYQMKLVHFVHGMTQIFVSMERLKIHLPAKLAHVLLHEIILEP